jgi:hypothetical protein
MAMDAGVATRNLAGDALNKALGRPATSDYDLPSNMFDQALDSLTTAPKGIGKAAEFVSTGLLGAKFPTPTGLNAADAQAIARVPAGFRPGVSNVPQLPPSPVGGLTGTQRAAATQGRQLGMQLTPGQASGSVPLQQLEARLASKPMTSGPLAAIAAKNQAVLNRTAAQAIGENSPTVDAEVLGRANDRLGNVFANVRSNNRIVAADPKATSNVLDGIDNDYSGLLPNDMSIRASPLVKQLESLTGSGSINGQQLGSLSSKLGRAAYKQMSSPTGDRDLGQALYGVKDHVDDLLQSTLSPDEAAEYAAARTQYRNLLTIASRGNIVNPSTGNVNGAALAGKLQQADKSGFLYGNNQTPLYQAARFSQAFKPLVGDSGTATRSAGHSWLGPAALLAGGHMAGLPMGPEAALAALPIAGRVAANLGTRVYLTRPGAAVAQALLTAPRLAGRAATAPWRAMAPAALAGSSSPMRALAPLGNPALLALGRPTVPMLPPPNGGQ